MTQRLGKLQLSVSEARLGLTQPQLGVSQLGHHLVDHLCVGNQRVHLLGQG